MASNKTRSKTQHAFFGQACELPKRQIPTCADVYRAYIWNQKKNEDVSRINDRIKLLAEEILSLYNQASIPVIEMHSVTVHIKRILDKVTGLEKYPTKSRSSLQFQNKIADFDRLFDVCPCKCFDAGAFERRDCKCPLAMKIPDLEWGFW